MAVVTKAMTLIRRSGGWRTLPLAPALGLATALCVSGCARQKTGAGAGPADEVRAQRFVLVDPDGEERAELGALSDGAARLVIRDKAGKMAAWVGVNGDGDPSLSIVDTQQNKPIAELVIFDGRPRLALCSPAGKPRAGIRISKDGGVGIDLLDASGRPRGSWDLDSLDIFDRNGSTTWHAP
jgi:hypothetical protein